MDFIDSQFLIITSQLISNGKKVFFILDNPFGEEVDPHSMLVRSWDGFRLAKNSLSKNTAIERSEPARSRLIEIARKSRAEIIDPIQYLCSIDTCSPFSMNGDLLYKDYDHLSMYSSKFMSSYLAPIFNR
jgi:hypothetical protein